MADTRPSEAVLLEVLRLNYAEATGVRRLDQQLVYVPLAGLAAVIVGLGAKTTTYAETVNVEMVLLGGLVLAVLVAVGLYRNHKRHLELLRRRSEILQRLHLSGVTLDRWFYIGRPVYYLMFLLGLAAEIFVIASLVYNWG